MAQRVPVPIIGPQAQAKNVAVNNQETLNFVHAIKTEGAKARLILESAPGINPVGTAGDGACRTPHMVNFSDELVGVFGTKLCSIDSNIVVTEAGTLDALTTPCTIARGRNYVMVVDGGKGYTWDGTTFATITDLDFPCNFTPAGIVTHVTYLDGYFICNDATTDNWYISALEDPTSWNALDFEAAAVSPDAALACIANAGILWVIGDETAQPYYNTGDSIFPYGLILSGVQEVGIAAPYTLAESDAGVFYLATTPEGGLFVYRIQGTQGRIISTEEVDTEIGSVNDVSGATAYVYQQKGKSFYVLTLDPSRPSLVYNIKANLWESRALIDGTAYRAFGHGVLGTARNIVGSRLNADLYELDLDVYTDADTAFIRRRKTAVIHKAGHLLEFFELVVDAQPAVGNTTDPGSDPMIRLRYSDDGGQTWGPQMIEPLGKEGETERRAVFRCLGQGRNRVFELEVSDQVDVTLINAYAVVRVLMD